MLRKFSDNYIKRSYAFNGIQALIDNLLFYSGPSTSSVEATKTVTEADTSSLMISFDELVNTSSLSSRSTILNYNHTRDNRYKI